MVGVLKTVRGLLILVALLLAVVPLAMLVDLLTSGTGYGLCEGGLAGCDTAHLAGPTVAARIFLGLVLAAGAIRVISRIVVRIEKQRRWHDVEAYYANLYGETAESR